MIELSTIRDLVAIFGVLAGFSYYVVTVQNQRKARQAQLLMSLYETYRSQEFRLTKMKIKNLEYTDFLDFWKQYGYEENPEFWAEWFSVAAFFNGIGVLVRRNMIDIGLVEELMSNIIVNMWGKMGGIILEWRKLVVDEKERKYDMLHGFEYLFNQIRTRKTIV
jgi:hypothetical protein